MFAGLVIFAASTGTAHKRPASEKQKVIYYFRILISTADMYMLENGKSSAKYSDLKEYLPPQMPNLKEYTIDLTSFHINKNQNEVSLDSEENYTFIYNLESGRLTNYPEAEPVR